MLDLEATSRFSNDTLMPTRGQIVTIFDAQKAPYSYDLTNFGKDAVTFGRGGDNDIVLTSPLVSHHHGRFVRVSGKWRIEDIGSTNGLIYNNGSITSREICDGDFIRIDDGVETVPEGVLFVFASNESSNKWYSLRIGGLNSITVGRDTKCTINLPHISVSKCHAKIVREGAAYYIVDTGSTNGVIVNNRRVAGRVQLHEKDVITITNSKLIFTSGMISYCVYKNGISVDASDIVIKRGSGRKQFITCNHVSLNIRPGELVAVIGGSGAGKSTILNCMCGYLKPAGGDVYINGVNLYQNFDSLKKMIGYVPQSDIVYDNLTLRDMLMYTAKLRLPSDISAAEREAAIDRAIGMVELTEKKNSFIKALSGGQRKRASIAVELLSDPNLLFLDEPASGLDPGTERNLMQSLREMADGGKTVILVTHSTLQLKLCDKIVFMGKGGNLCFCGSYDEALSFFGVSDIVDIYNMITDHAKEWSSRYAKIANTSIKSRSKGGKAANKSSPKKGKQLAVLCGRYMKLVANDRQRLLLLLAQAPLLAFLISLVADGNQFDVYEATKSLLFALSCSAFWVGMLNAIQEICKERTILKREYMTGLSLGTYVSSKIIVLGFLCLIQSLCISGVFAALVGLPSEGVVTEPFVELFITTFLTAVASASMGLFVSSMFTNADRAMTVAPILLMPQILFSNMIFTLEGITEKISWFAVCRWSVEAYGTTADLNGMPTRMQMNPDYGHLFEHLPEDAFDFSVEHLMTSWGIMLAFTVGFLILARVILSNIGKEK